MIPKGTWVQIHKILLCPEERAESLPAETRKVPFEMWDKGFLVGDAELGTEAQVITATGRQIEGTVIAVHPSYRHDYGDFVPEILQIDQIVKDLLYGRRS
jgi:hypothetical protein